MPKSGAFLAHNETTDCSDERTVGMSCVILLAQISAKEIKFVLHCFVLYGNELSTCRATVCPIHSHPSDKLVRAAQVLYFGKLGENLQSTFYNTFWSQKLLEVKCNDTGVL